jgi:uncharacterized phosphosugar-binding protein
MSYIQDYLLSVKSIIEKIQERELQNIQKAAELCAETLYIEGMIFTFGTGHSHMMAEEIFYRAGGLVRVYPILEESLMLHNGAGKSTSVERLEGYSRVILDNTPAKSGDTIIIFSNSGRNAVPVEMALYAREKGLNVIAVTNLTHAKASSPRNSANLHLHDVAHVVIDNHGILGDSAVFIEKLNQNICPTSTVSGAMIVQMIVAQTVEELLCKGKPPECFVSSNVDHGDQKNQIYLEKYSKIIKSL